MKKTITRLDGAVEVIEGSPQEIAEYENRPHTNLTKWEHESFCQLTIASRSWHSVVPPVCTCSYRYDVWRLID